MEVGGGKKVVEKKFFAAVIRRTALRRLEEIKTGTVAKKVPLLAFSKVAARTVSADEGVAKTLGT